ncbi:exported hypothetical protein [Candidatus Zixiibacteriota bacterium]|nr:exported hypothetical protein [candidate division Zixibacteria bacterium]
MRIFQSVVLILGAALIFSAVSALAVAPTEEVLQKMKDNGTLDAYIKQMEEARARGVEAPEPVRTHLSVAAKANQYDTVHVLVLLVDFSDNPASAGYVNNATPATFDSVLFSQGRLNPTGSMTEYYLENSYGKFLIKGDIYGWIRMPSPYSAYVGTDHGLGTWPLNAQKLTWDAVMAADSLYNINFSLYDNYGANGYPDGYVDGLFIVHAGTGFEESGLATDIHSHKWSLYPNIITKDGKTVDAYTCEPEESYISRTVSPIGVFCHEYGHFLGLPDLYVIDDVTPPYATGLGRWSVMAMGNYNGNSKFPAHFDAWCRISLGFASSTSIAANMVAAPIPQIETDPTIYALWKSGQTGGLQYFLVENRQQTGFDQYLPGSGLCIYHIYTLGGDAQGNNVSTKPYHVALEQADGLNQLESGANDGDAADTWPGSLNKRSFDDLSVPSSRGYGPTISQVAVWNISDSDSLMTANLDVTWSRPHFGVDSVKFSDANADGILDPGESVDFIFFIRNDWLTANNTWVTLSTNDPAIRMVDSSLFIDTFYGDGARENNILLPLQFVIPDTLIPTYDSFFVTISSDGGQFVGRFGFEHQVGPAQVLLVDDDRGKNYETLYWGDLYKRKVPADIWNKNSLSSPSSATLSKYKSVIWFTGDTVIDISSNHLAAADISAMKDFLNGGGNLFLTGQELATQLNAQDSSFLHNYLHAGFGGAIFNLFHFGVDGSPIGNGIKVRYASGTNQSLSRSAYITPLNGGIPAFRFDPTGDNYTAVSFQGPYRVVFFNWGYEAILNTNGPTSPYVNRDTVMANILNFFGGYTTAINDGRSIASLPRSFELQQNYPNPFNPMTTIRYSIRNTAERPIPKTVLRIYNILGQEVRTLIDRQEAPGNYSIEWDGTDGIGNKVGSGVYFYRLTRGNDNDTRKMVLLK